MVNAIGEAVAPPLGCVKLSSTRNRCSPTAGRARKYGQQCVATVADRHRISGVLLSNRGPPKRRHDNGRHRKEIPDGVRWVINGALVSVRDAHLEPRSLLRQGLRPKS